MIVAFAALHNSAIMQGEAKVTYVYLNDDDYELEDMLIDASGNVERQLIIFRSTSTSLYRKTTSFQTNIVHIINFRLILRRLFFELRLQIWTVLKENVKNEDRRFTGFAMFENSVNS